jgi:hypothetical protein
MVTPPDSESQDYTERLRKAPEYLRDADPAPFQPPDQRLRGSKPCSAATFRVADQDANAIGVAALNRGQAVAAAGLCARLSCDYPWSEPNRTSWVSHRMVRRA